MPPDLLALYLLLDPAFLPLSLINELHLALTRPTDPSTLYSKLQTLLLDHHLISD